MDRDRRPSGGYGNVPSFSSPLTPSLLRKPLPEVHDQLGLFGDLILVGYIYKLSKFMIVSNDPTKCKPPDQWQCQFPVVEDELDCAHSWWLALAVYAMLIIAVMRNWSAEVDMKSRYNNAFEKWFGLGKD